MAGGWGIWSTTFGHYHAIKPQKASGKDGLWFLQDPDLNEGLRDVQLTVQHPGSNLNHQGRKETPALLQLERWAALFLVSATVRAAPWEEEAVMVLFWSGEITVTSIAAGQTPDQNGR